MATNELEAILFHVLEEVGDEARLSFGPYRLPDRIASEDELRQLGYRVDGTTAKHRLLASWRHRCRVCGQWVKRLVNGECFSCMVKANKRDRGERFALGPLEDGILEETLRCYPQARATWD